MGRSDQVQAAGGVVWRRAATGAVEVLVIHRPRYDDGSFPTGKLDGAETFEEAAHRELAEETGLEVDLGAELPPATYTDHKGRPKIVRYWAMTVRVAGPWQPDDEVDEPRWLPVAEARSLLTYAFDRTVLDALHTVTDA